MKISEIDPAVQMRQAIAAISPKKTNTATARVNSRKPKFTIEDENVAQAV